ncbi:pseudouridine synthase [Fusobacterium sp.]|uniref:pseudouridine synthase n=1 Tax=Fusobacterium sp. TaxID=68766 RepID=UPI002610AE74|nr:pseudouridine synthase [Fusobacterium sp.]
MRLEKYLVQCGLGSRREIKEFVISGKIKVNNEIVFDEGIAIDEINDFITFNDSELKKKTLKYYILYKKAGYVTSASDGDNPVVNDLLPNWVDKKALFPVGRLDKDTEGLLLFTNDGELNYKMTHPEKKFSKKYYAKLKKEISSDDIKKIEDGIDIGSHTCLPSKIEIVDENSVYITIFEGKYHQVKRMFKAVNNKVVYLKRVEFGNLNLNGMNLGDVREIKREDILID